MTTKYTSKLQDKRVLVLGGTSGIGFCVAEASVESGAIVVVASSQQEKIDKTIQRIKTTYPEKASNISGHVCDLASPEVEANIKALLEFATNGGNDKLDHIVHTAGDIFGLTKIEEATAEKVERHGRVRVVGAIMLAKLAPQYMHSSPASSLSLTGGVNSTKPGPGWSVMAGWGAAQEGLARGLAVDLKPIRVNCVAPGAILTELFYSFGKDRVDQIVEHYKTKTLTGAIGNPEDMAEAYLYLMRDKFVTGTTLSSNGGYLLV